MRIFFDSLGVHRKLSNPILCVLFMMAVELWANSAVAQETSFQSIEQMEKDLGARIAVGDGANQNTGIFVGVSTFAGRNNRFSHLKFGAKDAIDMAYVFVAALRLIPATNCWLLLSSEELATRRRLAPQEPMATLAAQRLATLEKMGVTITNAESNRIIEALEEMPSRTAPSSLAVMYISSHGGIKSDGETFVAAENTRPFPMSNELKLQQINAYFAMTSATKRLVILDACRTREGARGPGDSDTDSGPGLVEAVRKALPSTAIYLSCIDNESAWEDESLGGGVFTQTLISTLVGRISSGTNEFVTFEQIAKHISVIVPQYVARVLGKSQTPSIKESTGEISRLPLAYSRLAINLQDSTKFTEGRLGVWASTIPPQTREAIDKEISRLSAIERKGLLASLNTVLRTEPSEDGAQKIGHLVAESRKSLIVPPVIKLLSSIYSLLPEDDWSIDAPVDGTPPLFFQWMRSGSETGPWAPMEGYTNRFLSIGSATPKDAGFYRLGVTNLFENSATSAVVGLKIRKTPLVILEHPFSPSDRVAADKTVLLSVKAAGGGGDMTQFRWYFRPETNSPWQPIQSISSTTSNLNLERILPEQSGYYRVRVFNSTSETNSEAALVNVIAPLGFVIPMEAGASKTALEKLAFQVGKLNDKTLCSDTALTINLSADGAAPLVYRLQKKKGREWADASSQTNSGAFTIEKARVEDSGTYRVVVDDEAGQSIRSPSFEVTVLPALSAVWPKDQTVMACNSAQFTVAIEGDKRALVSWLKKDGDSWREVRSNENALAIPSASELDQGEYKIEVKSACSQITSPTFRLTVNKRAFNTFTLFANPTRTFKRNGNDFFDSTGPQSIRVGTQTASGFLGTAFAIGLYPPLAALNTYFQALPCGDIIMVKNFFGNQIGQYDYVGKFLD